MIGTASFHGKFLTNGFFLHFSSLHADHSKESLTIRPLHKHIIKLDRSLFLFGLVLYSVGIKSPQDNTVQRLLALFNCQFIFIHFWLTVAAFFDFYLTFSSHMIVQKIVLSLNLPLAFTSIMFSLNFRRTIHILCEIVLILFLFFVLRLVEICIFQFILLRGTAR